MSKDLTNLKNQVTGNETKPAPKDIYGMLVAAGPEIAKALPKHLTPERMARIALTALRNNPKLASCTPQSFIAAVLTGAQLGLEINTPLAYAHIIPYKRNFKEGNEWKNVMEAQFQIGYAGIIELATRTGLYKSIRVKEVHAKDEFYYEYGLNADLKHKLCREEDPGPVEYIYALYELKAGGYDFEVWPMNKVINHAKQYSKSWKIDKKTNEGYFEESSAWATNPISMGKKTVLKAVLKYAPKSVEFVSQLEADEKIKNEIAPNMLNVPAIEFVERPALEEKAEEHGNCGECDEKKCELNQGAEEKQHAATEQAAEPQPWTIERYNAIIKESQPLKLVVNVKCLTPSEVLPILEKHNGDLKLVVAEIDAMPKKAPAGTSKAGF